MNSKYYYAFDDTVPEREINACSRASDEAPLIVNCAGKLVARASLATDNVQGREDYYLIFIIDGSMDVALDGDIKRVSAGDMLIFPPRCPYRYTKKQNGTLVYLWVHFTGTEVASLLSSLSLTGGVYHTDAPHQAEQDFAHMVRAHALHTAGGRVGAVGYLLTLLAHLSSAILPQEAQGNHGAVSDMAEFISRNWQKNISTAHVAAAVHLSESRAAHLFRMGMGISLHRYLEGIRIQNAKELLLDTDMTVSQISAMVEIGKRPSGRL